MAEASSVGCFIGYNKFDGLWAQMKQTHSATIEQLSLLPLYFDTFTKSLVPVREVVNSAEIDLSALARHCEARGVSLDDTVAVNIDISRNFLSELCLDDLVEMIHDKLIKIDWMSIENKQQLVIAGNFVRIAAAGLDQLRKVIVSMSLTSNILKTLPSVHNEYPALTRLYINHSHMTSFEAEGGAPAYGLFFPNLEYLDLRHNRLATLEPSTVLNGATKLREYRSNTQTLSDTQSGHLGRHDSISVVLVGCICHAIN